MIELDDHELLAEFARSASEAAFALLVMRHVNLVYSAALRFTGNPHHAEEITQAVFIIFSKKAKDISRKNVVSGWLYQTARLTAANFLKGEIRRQQREQESYMQSTLTETDSEVWRQLAPLLDEAMGRLGETDRAALVLRFFENKSAGEIAAALRINEDAAQRRVTRALEKLRKLFTKRGVIHSSEAITGAISAHSVQAAPALLAKSVAAAAIAKGAAASTSTLTLIKGTLKVMAWTKAKTTCVIAAGLLFAGGTTTIVATKIIEKTKSNTPDAIYEQMWSHPNSESMPLLEKAPPALIIRPTHYPKLGSGIWDRDGKGFFVNDTVSSIVNMAYECSPVRTIFPSSMPTERYDMMQTLPKGQNNPALREEIRKRFGLVAHKEIRNTDVLLLKVSDPEKLQSHVSKGRYARVYFSGDKKNQVFHFESANLADIAANLEGQFDLPIIDRSGLSDRYNFEFRWPLKISLTKLLGETLSEQLGLLGLELVPSREPVEMLIVEKEK